MKLLYAFPEPLPMPRARGVQVAHALRSLADTGVDITLAWVPVEGESPFAPTGSVTPSGLRLLPVPRGWPKPLDRLPPFSRWHSVRWFAGRLKSVIKETAPDVIYVRHLKLAALLLDAGITAPLIYEAHEVFADTTSPRKRSATAVLEKEVVRRAHGLVCNSQATATRLASLYGPSRRLLVLPNGVERPDALPVKPWKECSRHVVYAGSFFGWKGVDDLVEAAALLPGFRMTLIGGEPDQIKRLQHRIETIGQSGGAEIVLLPRLTHGEVMRLLAQACIAVLPNRADPDSAFTSPIKLFEYMAAGCAIVAADLPSIREILGPEEATWFASGDPAALAQALREASADPSVAASRGLSLHEKSKAYTWRVRAEKLRDFIAASID